MDFNTYLSDAQVVVSEDGEVTPLSDSRFDWRVRKVRTMRLGDLYDAAGYPDYAIRTRDCATVLLFGVSSQNGSKKLKTANFCKLRLCPMCIGRRARRNAWKLSQVLNLVEQEHGAKYLFLTLTIRNVPGDQLGDALGQLAKAWNLLLKQRQIERSVKGWFRAIEITRSGRQYHPHIHAILAVDADYFSRESRQSGKYLNQADLIERWQRALRVDYRPSVRIQTTKGEAGTGEAVKSAGGRAAVEAAKYALKDDEYIDPKLPKKLAVEIVRDYTEALRRRRLTAFGGWLKDAARALDAEDLEDGDLVHVDEDDIRADLAEMVEEYRWHLGAGDFVLTKREVNPLEVK